MAHNSTSRRRFGAAVGAFGVSVVAAAALIGMAGTASAHTPTLSSDCSDEGSWVKVELKDYNEKGKNSVNVVIDGEEVANEEFAKRYEETFGDLDPAASHDVQVVVDAWDDPDGSKGFSTTEELTIEACVEQPPTSTPTEPTQPEEPSEPAPTTSVPVTQVTDTEAPTTSVEVEEAALAETGASVTIPLVIGAVLLVGGVVLMVVVRRRGRADHQA